jgi:Zn-dependent protease/tetratricopeptide (TPR) repeat protein
MTQGSDLDKGGTTFGGSSSEDSQAAVQQLQDIVQQASNQSPAATATVERWKPLLQSPWFRKCLPSLAASLLLYSLMFGWWGSVVIVSLITIHEMGHWVWMKVNKCDPQPPMYVPLLGAFVMMKQPPDDEATTAWVALAGPLVGGTGAAIMYAAGMLLNDPWLVVGGTLGFLLNLTQLLPARPFDGGLVVSAISRYILIPGMLALITMAVTSRSPLLFLLSLLSIISYFHKPTRPAPKLEYNGKAKTIAELERELMTSDQTLASLSGSKASAANQSTKAPQSKLIPATIRQRWAIGTSYVVLAGVLSVLMVASTLQISSNLRHYASVGVDCLTNLLRMKEQSGLLANRSYMYALQNNFPAAEQDIKRALTVNSRDHDAYYLRATYKVLQGQKNQSVANDLLKSSEVSKRESQDAWNSTSALLLCGYYDEALRSCRQLSPSVAAGVKGVVLDQTGHWEEAAAYYDQAVTAANKPIHWGPRLRRAYYYLNTSQFDKAKSDLAILNKLPLRPSMIVLFQGWCDLKDGKLESAVQAADKVLGNKIEDIDLLQSNYLAIASHRLKAEVYARQALHEANASVADNYRRMAASEREKSEKIPGFGSTYIPRGVESWQ